MFSTSRKLFAKAKALAGKKYRNMIFFTTSLLSASKFARKACEKYGGNPVVYEVRPIGQYFNTTHGEYISEKALVIKEVN